METLATLINRKILILSSKTDLIGVEMHFLTQVLKGMVGQIFVDEDWYTKRYPDVVTALHSSKIRTAAEHYVLFGFYEHRIPHQILVDEEWYLTEYPDIKHAVQSRDFPSGQHHFEELGYREGRVPFPHFKLRMHNDENLSVARPIERHGTVIFTEEMHD